MKKSKPISNEDKKEWCDYGNALEELFLETQAFQGVFFALNQAKIEDKYAHDFTVTFPCDLKSIRTPWRMADKMFGIPSPFAISINDKDIVRYSELYPNIIIILDVNYPEYQATHFTDTKTLLNKINLGQAIKHEYRKRKDDKRGNSKASWIFDVRCFPVLV